MLQQSIKVSLIAVSVEQLTYIDIDGLKIFKFYEHPEISAQIELMKTEVMKYQTLADSITHSKYQNRKGSFSISRTENVSLVSGVYKRDQSFGFH